MGAIRAKILGACSNSLTASDFNGGRPVQKLELNLRRVDVKNVSIWSAFGDIRWLQTPRRGAESCSIDTLHLIKMDCDKPVSGNASCIYREKRCRAAPVRQKHEPSAQCLLELPGVVS